MGLPKDKVMLDNAVFAVMYVMKQDGLICCRMKWNYVNTMVLYAERLAHHTLCTILWLIVSNRNEYIFDIIMVFFLLDLSLFHWLVVDS